MIIISLVRTPVIELAIAERKADCAVGIDEITELSRPGITITELKVSAE